MDQVRNSPAEKTILLVDDDASVRAVMSSLAVSIPAHSRWGGYRGYFSSFLERYSGPQLRDTRCPSEWFPTPRQQIRWGRIAF